MKITEKRDLNQDLCAILNTNPFKKKISAWTACLKSFDYQGDSDGLPVFYLEDDKERFEKYNKVNGICCPRGHLFHLTKCTRQQDYIFHPEFIPQPFIGHPSAPIWLLNLNPSWFFTDVFAMLSISDEAKLQERICSSKDSLLNRNVRLNYQNGTSNELILRRKLMWNQLSLDSRNVSFFPLDPAFDVAYLETEKRQSPCSMYKWWSKCVLGNGFPYKKALDKYGVQGVKCAQVMARSLFVMEMIPYRSSHPEQCTRNNVDSGLFMKYNRESAYGEFWRKLVTWGLNNKRHIILRAEQNRSASSPLRKAMENLLGEEALSKSEQIHWLRSNQNVALSSKNVSWNAFQENVDDAVRAALQIEISV